MGDQNQSFDIKMYNYGDLNNETNIDDRPLKELKSNFLSSSTL